MNETLYANLLVYDIFQIKGLSFKQMPIMNVIMH